MEIGNGIELIQTSFGNKRPLNLVLFNGDEKVLVDTGLMGTPSEGILPEMDRIGVSPKDLSMVLVTHAHADHFGGNEEILEASGGKVKFGAHEIDIPFIEDPVKFTLKGNQPFVDLGVMSEDDLKEGIREVGNGIKVEVPLKGGEVFDFGKGLEVEVHFLPGHTPGNIALLEKSTSTFVIGETICGTSQYNTDGEVVSICNYDDIDLYLETITKFGKIDFDLVVFSHINMIRRKEMIAFLAESAKFVYNFDLEVKKRIEEAGKKITSVEIWKKLDGLWDKYGADTGMYYLLEVHLKSLLKRGAIEGSIADGFLFTGEEQGDLKKRCEEVIAGLPEC